MARPIRPKKARAFYEQFLARAGSEDRYKGAVDDVKRRCKTVKGQRRPNDKCISGRFQNIEDYLQALKDMEEMERLQKDAESRRPSREGTGGPRSGTGSSGWRCGGGSGRRCCTGCSAGRAPPGRRSSGAGRERRSRGT